MTSIFTGQVRSLRRGLHDVLGSRTGALWLFSPLEQGTPGVGGVGELEAWDAPPVTGESMILIRESPFWGGICDHWKCKWKWIQLSRVAIFLNYEFDVCLFQHATWLQWFWNLADAERKQETALRVWEARTWHLESFAWQLLHLDLSYKNQLYLKYTVVYLIPLKIFGVRVFDNPESLLGICLII